MTDLALLLRVRRALAGQAAFAALGLLAGAVGGAGCPVAFAATEAIKPVMPTLYERIAAGSLVVRARCMLTGKRATVQVLETLKGSCPATSLQIAFRSENFNRTPGSPKIEFQEGQESILVLDRERDDRDQLRGEDRWELVGGWRGKIDLPPEGGPALVQAAQRLAAIQAMKNQLEVWTAQRDLLREVNPILVTAGFEEILKFHLGDETLVAPLLAHLDGPRPEFRVQACKVLGQMFGKGRRTGKEIPSADLLTSEALARASGDESPEVRTEAVRALRELKRKELLDPLARIASSDPSQMVRFEALLGVMELRGGS
jgi:hypothetical protein